MLEQARAEAAAAGPIVDDAEVAALDLVGADGAFPGVARGRADGQDAEPVAVVLGAVAVKAVALEGIKAFPSAPALVGVAGPERVRVDGLEAEAVLAVLEPDE
jgi:hypothetical protein